MQLPIGFVQQQPPPNFRLTQRSDPPAGSHCFRPHRPPLRPTPPAPVALPSPFGVAAAPDLLPIRLQSTALQFGAQVSLSPFPGISLSASPYAFASAIAHSLLLLLRWLRICKRQSSVASGRRGRGSSLPSGRDSIAAPHGGASRASSATRGDRAADLLPASVFRSDASLDRVRPFLVVDPRDPDLHAFRPATMTMSPNEDVGEIVTFTLFVLAGLVPPFFDFIMEFLLSYSLRMTHLGPNAVITMAVFAHLCEAFVGVVPSVDVFRRFFKLSKIRGSDPGPGSDVVESVLRVAYKLLTDVDLSYDFNYPEGREVRLRASQGRAASWTGGPRPGGGGSSPLGKGKKARSPSPPSFDSVGGAPPPTGGTFRVAALTGESSWKRRRSPSSLAQDSGAPAVATIREAHPQSPQSQRMRVLA
ncbi:hypothetical protein PR202_gb27875 [Eleusine coracana subsp. coracana]|uniref:Transposase (putative) gypsy type domain-containing protein n=1 Tax=Eleusine coracana subsp. coracana TaxID=191504 RepID=A0AAV5FWE1_ELECO|nr:hypothetical protein PR202_gb27875 [Eleusine coracana subsp. coracana]